jgi:peptidoglycan/xylan/chitin deacetylase (PgdA/CDA1 family)
MDGARQHFAWGRMLLIVALVVAIVIGAAIAVWAISRSRDFQLFGEIVNRVETDEKLVALTFDDGPTPDYTADVLALLAAKDVKATFFVIGSDAVRHPDEMRAIVLAGHEVGNHTYSHDDMTWADEAKAAKEIEQTDAAIRASGYTGEIHFRPPFGKKLIGLPLYLAKHDRTTVTWDVEPESFDEVAATANGMASHVLANTTPGSIIILHVMYKARETSRQALPAIIDGLKERGFRFVTVSELLALRKS